jgi:hypothetical protein
MSLLEDMCLFAFAFCDAMIAEPINCITVSLTVVFFTVLVRWYYFTAITTVATQRYEFIPTVRYERSRWLRIKYCHCKMFLANVTFKIMTLGGRFQPSVQYYSQVIEECVERLPDLRPLFVPSGDTIDIFPCSSIHSHPNSAQFRSSSGAYLIDAVKRAGYSPYSVSSAKRDAGDGNRYFYCAKDFAMPYRDQPVVDNSALIFVDVDYYADMNRWLMLFKPICMYTLVPEVLNYNGSEYNYNFVGNSVNYNLSGGGNYQHELWNYKGDTITVVDDYGSLLVFDVEQRRINGDEQHRLVWLLPRSRVTSPYWPCLSLDINSTTLRRKVVKSGKLLYLWEPIDDRLSIGFDGSNYSVTLSGKLFEAIQTRLRFKDSAPFVSDVERMLKEAKHNEHIKDAPILFNCITHDVIIRPNVVKTGSFPVYYAATPIRGGLSTEDTKAPGQIVTTPLVSQPALFAAKGYNADLACIEGRLTKVRNNKKFPLKYRNYADEFVQKLIPKRLVGTGVPLSVGEVRVAQDKQAQRNRFDRVAPTMSVECDNKIKAFIKTETYASAKAPRNISTMTPEVTIQSSAYSLVMANVLKTHTWYCPGKTPKEITQRLADVMNMDSTQDIEEGDYTCMDGTQSADFSNLLLRPAYMLYFAKEYRNGFIKLYNDIYKNQATTNSGVSYKPEMTIRSGSCITTQANTINNAFNVYCALRNMGFTAQEAWDRIGAIFGDDSVNNNHSGNFHQFIEQVATELGMRYKSLLRARGEPVLFLGRYFVDPTTTWDSFADPMRTISKLHASTNKQVSREQAAANKAHGYLTTDNLTPIVGSWAKQVIKITGLKFKNATGEEQYRCSNAWPQRDRLAIAEATAKVLGVTVHELSVKDKLISEVSGLDQFPVVFDTIYKHTQQAVVDGDLVGTDLHQIDERTQLQHDRTTKPKPARSDCSIQPTCSQDESSVVNVRQQPDSIANKRYGQAAKRRDHRSDVSSRLHAQRNRRRAGFAIDYTSRTNGTTRHLE